MDVNINLKDAKSAPRLGKAGSFNAMVSHRVRLSQVEQVEQGLIGWLKQAYDEAS